MMLRKVLAIKIKFLKELIGLEPSTNAVVSYSIPNLHTFYWQVNKNEHLF